MARFASASSRRSSESRASPRGFRITSLTAAEPTVLFLRRPSQGYSSAMPKLPQPRGPVSELLATALARAPHELESVAVDSADPLIDEDLQLSLYVCYELAYRSFEGVAPRWEWNPSLIALRAELETLFEAALREAIGAPASCPVDPATMDVELREIAESDAGPSLSQYVEREATVGQIREFMIHRSAYQLKEADPHTWAIPRLYGPPKAAMVEVQADEYGGGRPERIHAQLFADAMEALGLDSTYGVYLDRIPGITLATVNLMSLCGLHRRRRGAIVGPLALFGMASSGPHPPRGGGGVGGPPGVVREAVGGPKPPLRQRPAAPGLRGARAGVLRRARRSRCRPRGDRVGRPRRRPGRAGPVAVAADSLGRP